MSAIGPKRTSLVAPHMSAFGGKADISNLRYLSGRRNVCLSLVPPVRKWLLDEVCVVVTGVFSDFVTQPFRFGDDLVFALKFHLGDNQSCVGAQEFVNFPGEIACRNLVAATQTIPIVFTANGDPVRSGLVTSLSRPTTSCYLRGQSHLLRCMSPLLAQSGQNNSVADVALRCKSRHQISTMATD